ncbi:MAG: hypothetical protein ACLRSW_05410 [Christensenellaceae bacterium]
MKTIRFANVVRLFGADVLLLLGLFGRLASALAKAVRLQSARRLRGGAERQGAALEKQR